jgi:hypothetical protein
MQIKRRSTLGIFFSLMLIVGAAGSFTAPRTHALGMEQANNRLSLATRAETPQAQKSSQVTSTIHHIACARRCEEKYSSCLAAKKAKGWDADRAEKMCGLSARSCKGSCDRR